MKTQNSLLKIEILILALIAILGVMNSCTWKKAPLVSHGNDGIKDSVCYLNEIQPIINSNCAMSGCHDPITQAAGYDLSSYFVVMNLVKPGKPDQSKLIQVMNGGGEDLMPPPPNPPMNQEQVDLIRKWISEGAGLNIDCNITIPCDTSNVTYSGTIVTILQTNCLGCHSSSGSGGGVLLNNYSNVKNWINNGRLWGAVNWNAGYSAMPKNGSKLSDCDIKKIGIWIQQGAPNN
jgi:mono/diheme cytochrome c family protein